MSLPTAISYEAPLAELPASRAQWTLHPARAALLVHDMQRYFLRIYDPECPALRAAIANTSALIEAARTAGVPVFYTAQTGTAHEHITRGLQADLWGAGMRADPEHTEIIPELAPADGDTVLVKHRYDAFAHSPLGDDLAARGRDQLIICGVYAHIGILATALTAFQREIQPFLAVDAVADFDAAEHRRAIEQVASCTGVAARTADLLAALQGDHPMTDPTATADAAPIDARLRTILDGLVDPAVAAACMADADADWFAAGLDSLRAFELLDQLADDGIDIDYGEFVRTPTLAWLRSQAAQHATV